MHLVFLVILLHFVNAMRYTASNLRLDENDFLNFHKFLLLNFSHREIFHVILAAAYPGFGSRVGTGGLEDGSLPAGCRGRALVGGLGNVVPQKLKHYR